VRRLSLEVIVSRRREDLQMEKFVGVKCGLAWRTRLRVAGLFWRVFGVVMYMGVMLTIEFL
jgi:hypothetical protein